MYVGCRLVEETPMVLSHVPNIFRFIVFCRRNAALPVSGGSEISHFGIFAAAVRGPRRGGEDARPKGFEIIHFVHFYLRSAM